MAGETGNTEVKTLLSVLTGGESRKRTLRTRNTLSFVLYSSALPRGSRSWNMALTSLPSPTLSKGHKSYIILFIRSLDVILFSITPLFKYYIGTFCISVTNYGRNSLRERIPWFTVSEVSGHSSLTLWSWPEHHSGGNMWEGRYIYEM